MLKFTIKFLSFLMVTTSIGAQTVDHSTMDHASHMSTMSDTQRQAEVAERGQDVMPFSLDATTHIFTKNPQGGIQQVVSKIKNDEAQVMLIQKHLQDIRVQFLKGDFSAPAKIHGQEMPGLSALMASKAGQITIEYQSIEGGAELVYLTNNADLVLALHQWFDAQLQDHGKDAMEGNANHHSGMKH
jgi:hypothetical protein